MVSIPRDLAYSTGSTEVIPQSTAISNVAPASLAFAIATSAANVIKIAAQQYKSKGGGGGGTPAGGGAGAVAGIGGAGAAVPSFNLFGQGNVGGATQATPETQTQQQQITVKAVVVESDVTQTQKNVSAIESASEL